MRVHDVTCASVRYWMLLMVMVASYVRDMDKCCWAASIPPQDFVLPTGLEQDIPSGTPETEYESTHLVNNETAEPAEGIKDGETLIHIMVEMQKRTETTYGIQHTVEEETEVDYYFEDDIILTEGQAEEILQDMSKRHKRKLAAQLSKRWSLPIPYMYDGTHSTEEIYKIRMALSYWQELTCITFKENPHAQHKLLFVKGRGCWSYVGFVKQPNQTISIGDGCQSNGTIAHEVGHAIGFWHEQSRPDRDDFVQIHPENVSRGKLYNFDKRTWGEIITLGVPYDPGSDMHYGSKFYAKDANSTLSTVVTRDPLLKRVIGQRQELSFYDVKLANKAYCADVCSGLGVRLKQPCQRDGYQDPTDCRRCRCPDGFTGDFCETVSPGNKANCGGVYHAEYPGTIASPGYPMYEYSPEVACSWHIKAPTGKRVYLKFTGSFGVAGHVDVCKDYVEVRYNTSLALTGARFCVDDPPRTAIVSEGSEMLVLFRTFRESRVCDDVKYPWKCSLLFVGFSARYYTESCGGCGDTNTAQQRPCLVQQPYTCRHTWSEKRQDCGTAWWYKGDCKPTIIRRTRNATCYRFMPECCGKYQFKDNNCIAMVNEQKRSSGTRGENSILPHDDYAHQTLQSWSGWSEWGRCSQTCGGGIQVRTRQCDIPSMCGHEGMQFDRRLCNNNACQRICSANKVELCDFWIQCKRTVFKVCESFCSPGFNVVGDHCL